MFKPVNQKQSFPELEQEIINFWKQEKTFEKSVETRPEEKPYRFYDWPPFITWMPHYWHLLASTIKDIVPRYQTMQWKRVERVWWWDCHGIAVEEKVMKKLWLNSNREIETVIWVEKFIEECYKYTKEISWEWEWYIDHIWRWVDFKNAYKTMDKSYMESVMWTFKQMYDKWLVYKGKRISFYSVKLWTPISNFEVAMDDSYEEVKDPAVTIKFKLKDSFDTKNFRESTWIVVKNSKWQVLLWKKKKNWLLTFPWGKSENWESAIECAKRELFEETWIKAENLELYYSGRHVNDWVNWRNYVYNYEVPDDFIIQNPENHKFDYWKFF
jgi:isoleucyl-tRNA synthetase